MIVCCIFKLCDILWNGWSNGFFKKCKVGFKKIEPIYWLLVVKGFLNTQALTFAQSYTRYRPLAFRCAMVGQ